MFLSVSQLDGRNLQPCALFSQMRQLAEGIRSATPKNTTSEDSPPFIRIAGVPEIETGFRPNIFTLRSKFFHFLTIADKQE